MARKTVFSCYPSSSSRDDLYSDDDVFQLLFLSPENHTVEAWETNFIECEDLVSHLKSGGSVFISSKKQNRSSTGNCVKEMKKPAYFRRV